MPVNASIDSCLTCDVSLMGTSHACDPEEGVDVVGTILSIRGGVSDKRFLKFA